MEIGTYTIRYDNTLPGWTAVNSTDSGQPQHFQTGAVGQQAAIRFAITETFPAVAKAVKHLVQLYPETSGRAWAAAQLLVCQHVLVPGLAAADNCLAWVQSQQATSTTRHYQLRLDGRTLTCDCPDFQQGGVAIAGQLLCKHLLAYRLACHLDWPLTAAQPASQPRRVAGGQWRGRTTTAVGPNHRPQPVTPDSQPAYADGAAIAADHLPAYQAFVAAMRQRPFNLEKLMSWYMGR